MTVSATTYTRAYTGDGSTTEFSTVFSFQGTGSSAELEVIERVIATGVETTKSYSTHYTVTGGNGSTGTVIAASAPADTVQWHIRRKTTTTQTSNYVTNDPFPADTLEGDIDRLAMSGQERDGDISQAFRYPDTYTGGASIRMPEPTANRLLQWNSDGDALTNGSEVSLPTSLTANNFLQVNSGATNYDMKTAAQVFTSLLSTESNGIIAHAGSGAAEPRTITGTSNQITLANGDGVSGNPTISIPDAITFTGKTVTGGTYSSMVATSTMAGDPSSAMHIATKQYVDSVAAGLRTRLTVRAATTANITIATALNNGDTLDGVTLANDDLVLVKDQSSAAENGIYKVAASPARHTESDTWDEIIGQLIAVQEGTANADDLYLCTSNTGGTLNSTAIAYTKIYPGSGGTVTSVVAGTGLSGGTITGSGTIALDINSLSTEATIDTTNDFVAFYDATDTAANKATIANFIGSAGITQGTHTIWVPAAAMRPTVSNGCAVITDVETTAGRPDMQVLDFDASADEHAQFQISFPKSWNEGTITFAVYWTTTATDTDGVAWGLQGVAVSDNDTIDVAYGTGVVVTDDALSAAEDLMVTATSGAVTIAGSPAAGDICYFRIYRDVSDGNDDMTEDARLIGCKIFYTINSKDDS
tara:strand:+ start:6046 stop:7983 length:1938 start_codon:yes stop_codon:yes gene_type:complete